MEVSTLKFARYLSEHPNELFDLFLEVTVMHRGPARFHRRPSGAWSGRAVVA